MDVDGADLGEVGGGCVADCVCSHLFDLRVSVFTLLDFVKLKIEKWHWEWE